MVVELTTENPNSDLSLESCWLDPAGERASRRTLQGHREIESNLDCVDEGG